MRNVESLGDLQKDFSADLEGRRRWIFIPGRRNFILIWFLRPLRWTTTVVLTGLLLCWKVQWQFSVII